MNRNTESHFSLEPSIRMNRSKFDRSASLKTSFNAGQIVPFYLEEVLPGDTFNVKTSKVVRMETLITPIMDNIYLDTYYFYVPNRLVWQHWKEFCGENTESAWIPQTEYAIPQITSPASTGWDVGTIADYFGIPTGVAGLSVNALPFRAYALICNEWFRDENLSDPLVVPVDDSTVAGVNTGTDVTDVAKGGLPYKAAKYHDYFTSCLPAPQKGPDVAIPVAQAGNLPVVSSYETIPFSTFPKDYPSFELPTSMEWYDKDGNLLTNGVPLGTQVSNNQFYTQSSSPTSSTVYPANLWAIQDGSASAATINQLRLAFQVQKFYEQQARGGSRYTEIVRSFFGVTSPDARLQRPEYLGGNRVPINVNQVVQQSETSTTPQGTVAGMSLTTDTNSDFIKSFTEHGYIIGVMVARYDHTYQQGLNRLWSRSDKFDFYWPVFANIGEQAVKNKEIFAQGEDEVDPDTGEAYDEGVFGYQEAWADYRYKPNMVTGQMRSQYAQSLDVWHLADDYSTLPALSDSWIREDASTIDRVISVTTELANQFFADIYVKNLAVRPMPMYSVPGLIDHH